jgi:hypothetical protein
MTLQYLEALKALGSTAATKYVIPLELTDLARRLGNFLDNGLDSGQAVRMGTIEDATAAPGSASSGRAPAGVPDSEAPASDA